MNYPIEIGRSRGPFSMLEDDFFRGSLLDDNPFGSFGRRLAVTKVRPIVADAMIEPILVKPIPSQNRPGDYVGAVGRYNIVAEAAPKSVEVGDPITLHLGIDGNGSMDVVRAPPLALQQDLVRDFKVNNEPLAGFVDGSRKVFTTTIRPLRDDVTEIPAIEYTYFDPQSEEFVTTKSKPIPIEVSKADVLALDAIVGSRGNGRGPFAEESNSTTAPIVTPNLFAGTEVLASVERPTIWTPPVLRALLAPIAMFLLAAGFAFRSLPSSLVSSQQRFRKQLQHAESGAGCRRCDPGIPGSSISYQPWQANPGSDSRITEGVRPS